MSKEFAALRMRQLEESLDSWRGLTGRTPPTAGWVRSIRDALGMSAAQLGQRLGVSRQAVASLEQREVDGAVTLAALRDAADALDAELVYAIVPREPLPAALDKRALHVAQGRMDRVAQSMALEGQAVPRAELARQVEDLRSRLVRERPRWLWDADSDQGAESP